MAYFAMLSGQGWTVIAGCRQFFYSHFVERLITSTLILILMGNLAGAGTDLMFGACGSNGKLMLKLYMS